MTIIRRNLSDLPPLTPDEIARRKALGELLESRPPHPEAIEWTDEDWARATKASDYPSPEDAMDEAEHLADMQAAGMGVKELEAYKASRTRQPAAV